MKETNQCDLVVIGGGPAGMMCAVTAAERGLRVILTDGNRSLGRKLRITGKGRCNLTNNCEIRDVLNNIPRNGKFLHSALHAFPPSAVMEYFEGLGVPLKTERGSRVFPQSDNANDIADAMASACRKAGVKVLRTKAEKILTAEGKVTGVRTGEGDIACRAAALCTGGLSYPLTGSTGFGYRAAAELGHTVEPARPSLVPLESDDPACAELQGLSLKNVALTVYEEEKPIYSDFGEMLFTHFGVSGPIVLSASAHMRSIGEKSYCLSIDLKPALDEKTLDARILRDFQKALNRDIRNALNDLLPSSLIPVVIRLAEIPEDTKVHSITREQRERLRRLLKAFPVSVSGTRPIDEAIITSGGVSVKEIDPRTMESKLVPGLYFAGEIIDVDAYTGGFNLQIAWSTGYMAGRAVCANKEKLEESMKEHFAVAIDGPSGAGKSSMAKKLAARFGLIYVDTGAIYRTVGLAAHRKGISCSDEAAVSEILPSLSIEIRYNEEGEQRMILNGEDVSTEIRLPEISICASDVSALPAVRAFLLEMQRAMARSSKVVMDGRDIGTVVLPDAEVKIFLTASAKARAERRLLQLEEKGVHSTFEEVLRDIEYRDKQDSSREIAPLRPAEDAVLVDSSDLDFDQTLDALAAVLREKLGIEG